MKAPSPSRQLAFHQLLVGARKTWLTDALQEALKETTSETVKRELAELLPADVQQILAQAGVRDEYVFPAPSVLAKAPTLLGYYRLLLGTSQKSFYAGDTGFGAFKTMETHGSLNERQRAALPEICAALAESLADLVRQLSPGVTARDIGELPLLTLGSQFQGANNNVIGQQATREVFLAIADVVESHLADRTESRLTVENASGRTVLITLAADPDVRIQEEFDETLRAKVAVEIKGGTDRSNAHNRAGEAEKSHRKALAEGYRDFWTIIALRGVDRAKLEAESPTTRSWFDAAEVLGRDGPDWDEFASRLAGEVGLPGS